MKLAEISLPAGPPVPPAANRAALKVSFEDHLDAAEAMDATRPVSNISDTKPPIKNPRSETLDKKPQAAVCRQQPDEKSLDAEAESQVEEVSDKTVEKAVVADSADSEDQTEDGPEVKAESDDATDEQTKTDDPLKTVAIEAAAAAASRLVSNVEPVAAAANAQAEVKNTSSVTDAAVQANAAADVASERASAAADKSTESSKVSAVSVSSPTAIKPQVSKVSHQEPANHQAKGDAIVPATVAEGEASGSDGSSKEAAAKDENAAETKALPKVTEPKSEVAANKPVEIEAQTTVKSSEPLPLPSAGTAARSAGHAHEASRMVELSPLPTPESEPDGNVARVARGLQSAIAQRGGSVTLRLQPPELGLVRVELAVTNGTASVRFQADAESVRTLLSHQMASLRHALERHGLSVERMDVQQMPVAASAGRMDDGTQGNGADNGRSRGQFFTQQQSSGGGSARSQQHASEQPESFAQALVNTVA
ncbi:MAG: flagellar hook-length control protein FliK [Phycisphaeraceae bacterium]|nr:flagellar hook-length control protein FliK [Phycisphaeraceae bacterium]